MLHIIGFACRSFGWNLGSGFGGRFLRLRAEWLWRETRDRDDIEFHSSSSLRYKRRPSQLTSSFHLTSLLMRRRASSIVSDGCTQHSHTLLCFLSFVFPVSFHSIKYFRHQPDCLLTDEREVSQRWPRWRQTKAAATTTTIRSPSLSPSQYLLSSLGHDSLAEQHPNTRLQKQPGHM